MDSKVMFEAAWEGNVEVFRKILKENPSVVIDIALSFPSESLLHVATKSGQVDFVRELINHDHELAKELNKDGFRALDIASMMGNVELVKELIKNDHGICRLKGKDQRTALHYATIKGRIEVIDELLSTCPQAIEDTTVHKETALHLAVKNNQSDAFRLLVSWLGKLNMEAIINASDRNGNTVLHLAASSKQVDIIELLLNNNNSMSEIVEVNATNLKGLTAMDVVDIVIESPNDLHLKETFQRAGALDAQHANTISTASPHQAAKTEGAKNVLQPNSTNCWPKCLQSKSTNYWLKHLKLEKERDSPKVRNELLVVAALIATVTFQAGVDPPDGIREERLHNSLLDTKAITFLFVFANTMGLTASLSIVTYLTTNFPFQRELLISMVSMIFAYGFAIASVTNDGILYTFLASAFIITFFQRWVIVWGGKIRKARDKLPVTSKAITHDGGSGTNS